MSTISIFNFRNKLFLNEIISNSLAVFCVNSKLAKRVLTFSVFISDVAFAIVQNRQHRGFSTFALYFYGFFFNFLIIKFWYPICIFLVKTEYKIYFNIFALLELSPKYKILIKKLKKDFLKLKSATLEKILQCILSIPVMQNISKNIKCNLHADVLHNSKLTEE